MNTTPTLTKTVKQWLQDGEPLSYAKDRRMSQISTFTPSDDPLQCRALMEFSQQWAKDRPGERPPVLIHFDEKHVALYARWGLRKGAPLFNPKKAAAALDMPAESAKDAESRRAFEKWRKTGGYQDKRDQWGRYTTPEGRSAWQSWQASRLQLAGSPGVHDSTLVSEHRKAYDYARSNGYTVEGADVVAMQAVRSLLLPVQVRLSVGVTAAELAEHLSRSLPEGLPLDRLPDFRRQDLLSQAGLSLAFLGIPGGPPRPKAERLDFILAGLREAMARELKGV